MDSLSSSDMVQVRERMMTIVIIVTTQTIVTKVPIMTVVRILPIVTIMKTPIIVTQSYKSDNRASADESEAKREREF